MSRRRRSGTSLLETSEEILELKQKEYDDFRRRHSRQNREIISENIVRNRTVRDMQEQIRELQAELLNVQQQNVDLKRRMALMHDEACRVRGEVAIEALDQILAAIPGLRQIREVLAATVIPEIPTSSLSTFNHSFVNPTATRPAASAAGMMGLVPLNEVNEEASPSPWKRRSSNYNSSSQNGSPGRNVFQDTANGSPNSKRTPPRKNHRKRRESGMLPLRVFVDDLDSPAASPAKGKGKEPNVQPNLLTPSTSSSWVEVGSSGNDASEEHDEDLVEAAVTPRTERRAPGRHVKDIAAHYEERLAAESLPASLSPSLSRSPDATSPSAASSVHSPAVSPAVSPVLLHTDVPPSTSPSGTSSAASIANGRHARAISIPVARNAPSIKRVPVPKLDDNGGVLSDASSTLSPPPPTPPSLPTELSAVLPPPPAVPLPPVPPPATAPAPSTAASSPGTEAAAVRAPTPEAKPDEETGRPRRARGSVVNYKEPSLNKKMRKPDGTVLDDLLGVMNRPDPAVTGVRRKSALPRSTTRVSALPDERQPENGSHTSAKEASKRAEKTPSPTEAAPAAAATSSAASSPTANSARRTNPAASKAPVGASSTKRISPSSSRAALGELDNASSNVDTAVNDATATSLARRTTSAATAIEKRRRNAVV